MDPDEYGKVTFLPPEIFDCDYSLGSSSKRVNEIGLNFVVKNTFWTEYEKAKKGDFVLLGEYSELNPMEVNADEIRHIIQDSDITPENVPDFTIITAV